MNNFWKLFYTATGNPKEVLGVAEDSVKSGNFKQALHYIVLFLTSLWETYKEVLASFLGKIVFAIIVYFIGKKVVGLASSLCKKALEKSRIEISVSKFLSRIVSVMLNALLFIIVVGILGVPTASFVAVLGTVGLAVGLSLQGSLSNFAGGVLILILKPFKVNDYIIAAGVEGKVRTIDIFYTKIVSIDNKKICIPNGTLVNTSIQNIPITAKKRLDFLIPVDYKSDIKQIREVLIDIAKNHKNVYDNEEINVFVDSLDDMSIAIGYRVWTSTKDYWEVKCDLLEQIIYRFREEGIDISYNKLGFMFKDPE